jgi:hypothetical protein
LARKILALTFEGFLGSNVPKPRTMVALAVVENSNLKVAFMQEISVVYQLQLDSSSSVSQRLSNQLREVSLRFLPELESLIKNPLEFVSLGSSPRLRSPTWAEDLSAG